MKVFFVALILVLTGVSCQKDVDLDQPSYQEKIVVDGYIETGRSAMVFLTMSSPFLTHYDSVSIRNTFLNYAKISLVASTGETEVLTLFRENKFFPPFVYKSVGIKGVEGESYQLKIEVKGKVVTAETTIPPAEEVLNTRFNAVTDTTGILEFATRAPVSGAYYLFTRMRSHLNHEDFHPSYLPVAEVSDSQGSFVWHTVFRSSEFNYYLANPESSYYNGYSAFEYDLRDTVDIIVGTVDSISYRVIKSLFVDRSNQENPFAFNGNRIETNINGGIGRWTGIGYNGVKVAVAEN